jgi:DNA processing protein
MDPALAHLALALAEGGDESCVPALLDPDLAPADLLAAIADPAAGDLPARVRGRLSDPSLLDRAAALRDRAAALGLAVLTPADAGYPPRLRHAPLRPLALFARGDCRALSIQPAVAIVGSRNATAYGRCAAEDFAAGLARAGLPVWSGLARGIDAAAHRAALAARGPTVAVLAGGLDAIYPPEHRELADAIVAAGGCLLAELPPGRRARRGHFPRRNRILAGATAATLVVEAAVLSGALITARLAAEAGATVLAVPGPYTAPQSRGCHRLLADGALVAGEPADVLRELGVAPATAPAAAHALQFSADAEALLGCLQHGPRPADLVHRESGLERPAFLAARLQLERAGRLRALPGDLLAASPP